MAGRGPAPKLPQERRNKTAPQRGDWIELPPLDEPVLPELPEVRDDGCEWRQATRDMWEAWRWDPASAQWSAADRALARDTIVLYDEDSGHRRANEVRLRMESLGLTPKGRQDRRWRIADGAAAPAAAPRRPARGQSDRRARLTVVKP